MGMFSITHLLVLLLLVGIPVAAILFILKRKR